MLRLLPRYSQDWFHVEQLSCTVVYRQVLPVQVQPATLLSHLYRSAECSPLIQTVLSLLSGFWDGTGSSGLLAGAPWTLASLPRAGSTPYRQSSESCWSQRLGDCASCGKFADYKTG